jgi:hypothetical protein
LLAVRFCAAAAVFSALTPLYCCARHHSNRSAALLKLGKARQALADADAAIALRPDWEKGHYRRGVALEARAPSRSARARQRMTRLLLALRLRFLR